MIEVAADFQELARHELPELSSQSRATRLLARHELPELSSQSRATRLHRLLILDTQLMVA